MELYFLWKCNERKIQLLWVFAEAFEDCLVRFNTVLYYCSVSRFCFAVIGFSFFCLIQSAVILICGADRH